MTIEQFQQIANLEGLEFITALLRLEEERFEESQFLAGSTFEDINVDFGIFPKTAALPVYFAGNIREPENKIILMGINPGYDAESYPRELAFLRERGLFEGYCNLYAGYFGDYRKRRKVRYYSNIASLLRGLGLTIPEDYWDWYQENFISLEFIPYHSANANGLRINDKSNFRKVYFEIILKLLRHLNPQNHFFINGFPTFRGFVANKKGVFPEYANALRYEKHERIWTGSLGDGFDFVGLPFLGWLKGGKDALVDEIKRRPSIRLLGDKPREETPRISEV